MCKKTQWLIKMFGNINLNRLLTHAILQAPINKYLHIHIAARNSVDCSDAWMLLYFKWVGAISCREVHNNE